MEKKIDQWYARQIGDQMDKYAESTVKYAAAAEQLVKEYAQARGEASFKGMDWTAGSSTAPSFSENNPLAFITETPGHYAEAHFADGSYWGFSGEAYSKLVELSDGSANAARVVDKV